MKEREGFQISETKAAIYHERGGICEACGNMVVWPGELAHRIPQTAANLKAYGKKRIHHPLNLALVCMGSQRCNSAMSIGYNPGEEETLISEINEAIKNEH